jgi:hypothetical protein
MSIAPAQTSPPAPATASATPQPRDWNPLAALLSYLVPGLGQISQGRVGKGVLFFVCIYLLFFYGTVLGSGSTTVGNTTYRISSSVYLPDTATPEKNNPLNLPTTLANLYNRPQFVAQFWVGIAAWPAIWQYLHYDEKLETDSVFGTYQRTPNATTNNAVNTNVGRSLDLGWVFTVIAGVLNILVIYDALAGPAFQPAPSPEPKAS